jgi:hypothetical protein
MCFSLSWVENVLIWLVVVGAIIAIVRLFLPLALAQFGGAGTVVMQVLNIIIWAFVLIAIIILAFELLSCLMGSSGAGLSLRR